MTWWVALGGYLIWRIARSMYRNYARSVMTRRQWALILAQPMIDAVGMSGFFDPDTPNLGKEAQALFRIPLLHQLGCHTHAGDGEVRQYLVGELEPNWFCMDLQGLTATDDPRAALAFACVRTTFLIRNVMLMGWVEPAVAWRVLLLNAQRAQDCFDGWEDLGRAYMQGRSQWVKALRADPLGRSFDESHLRALLSSPAGAWSVPPWPGLPAFDPQATGPRVPGA